MTMIVAIVIPMRGCGGEMSLIVDKIETRELWVVASIADSSDEYGTRSLLFERFCESEDAAIDLAERFPVAIVFSAKRIRQTISLSSQV
jgi:hypothetical protein